jgi:putative transcriptional regulator
MRRWIGTRRVRGGNDRHGLRVLCALVLLGAVLVSGGEPFGRSVPAGEQATGSLKGQLLVATPEMGDPRFAETVLLMLAHDAEGALGIIVNRPVTRVVLPELLRELGIDGGDTDGELVIHNGGPVERELGFLLHSTDRMAEGSEEVIAGIAVTTRPEILQAIAGGDGPTQYLFAFGYAGWGPYQLEGEILREDWFWIPADPALVFAADPSKTWRQALARRRIDL